LEFFFEKSPFTEEKVGGWSRSRTGDIRIFSPNGAKFKPTTEMVTLNTVGEFLDQVKAVGGLRPATFEIYARKFRTLVSGSFGIKGGKRKV